MHYTNSGAWCLAILTENFWGLLSPSNPSFPEASGLTHCSRRRATVLVNADSSDRQKRTMQLGYLETNVPRRPSVIWATLEVKSEWDMEKTIFTTVTSAACTSTRRDDWDRWSGKKRQEDGHRRAGSLQDHQPFLKADFHDH